MDERRPPAWFWIVAVIAFLWEAMGCYAYLAQIGAADDVLPAWISAAFAVAVWVGVSGGILLLMRQRLARMAFIVSLVGVVIQYGGLALRDGLGRDTALFAAVVALAGLALIWFAHLSARRGWLR